jgi:hypothetical protein
MRQCRMEHFFPRDIITITTSMVVEDQPASNDNKVNATPGNTNRTFGQSNLSMLKQNTPYSYVK